MRDKPGLDRRALFGVAAGAGTLIGAAGAAPQAEAEVLFPTDRRLFGGGGSATGAVHRSENDLYDCEVEGDLPDGLDGAFYRVGPDPQYPKPDQYKHDIGFDGEGHVSMFRIKNGHVDYKSRYVRTQRWLAQHEARRSLWGIYRNPYTNDPLTKGKSAGTANTQMWFHHGKLMALKEDSPPVTMDPLTLETIDNYYTFGGGLKGETFTAHPKNDPVTGEMIGFGFEAKGLYSKDIEVFSVDKKGKVNWHAWVKAPHTSMIHDFAATQKHIAFLTIPLAANEAMLKAGGPHWFYDSSLPSYLGVMRRGGDGKDIRWLKGPSWMATHSMGCWSDGEKIFYDMDGAAGNQFPFFPNVHANDPLTPPGQLHRMTVDVSRKDSTEYGIEKIYTEVAGGLARQDDRYHGVPYRWGFLNGRGWQVIDQQTGKTKTITVPDVQLSECCFVPRKPNSPEGDGYLIGVGSRTKEGGRSDLIIVDLQDIDAGPRAVVKMPYRVVGQVHGFWVNGVDLPKRG